MKTKIKAIEYGPLCDPKHMHGYKGARWVENVSRGVRLIGFADEIAQKGIRHNGWYTDEDGANGELCRGIVYQLPARDGETLYVYGYADPNSEDCALLNFEPETDKMDAARAADRFAEIFAEEAREYNTAWQAGRRCDEIAEEVAATRKEALTIAEEMRAAKRAKLDAPTICATLRGEIMSLYRRIQKARKERDELIDAYGSRPGFAE
jgi:hypothetical protein